MGRSDPLVFRWYAEKIKIPPGSRVLFLGQPAHNSFTATFSSRPEFRDITLGNWNIRDGVKVDERFDAIVCTRCAYFSDDPGKFLDDCKKAAKSVYVDWGLGDHWRFSKYRVGWRDDHEHEYAEYCGRRNFLYSTVWRDDFEQSAEVASFESLIGRKGYSSLRAAVFNEVPVVHGLGPEWNCDFLPLWPDSPQLYILTSWSES